MFLRGQEQAIMDEEDKTDDNTVEGDEGGIANGKYSLKKIAP